MIVGTKFMTVKVEELAGVGRNDQKELFLVFASGSTQRLVYNNQEELEKDYLFLTEAMVNADKPKLSLA